MKDFTKEYFASCEFVEGVRKLSEFENIEDSKISDIVKNQVDIISRMKKKFDQLRFK